MCLSSTVVVAVTDMKSLLYSDQRQGYCFTSLSNGRCLSHANQLRRTTKSQCCCGMGAAWGPRCEKCPRSGTRESTVTILSHITKYGAFEHFLAL